MRFSFEETVEIETLTEAAAVGGKDDCRGIAERATFGQLTPNGTDGVRHRCGTVPKSDEER